MVLHGGEERAPYLQSVATATTPDTSTDTLTDIWNILSGRGKPPLDAQQGIQGSQTAAALA